MSLYKQARFLPQRFRLILSSFLQQPGLAFANALPEDAIQKAFDDEDAVAIQTIAASWMLIVLCDGTVLSDGTLATRLIDAALVNLAQHIVGNRPGRIETRAIKRRPKPHDLLTKPRHEARAQLMGDKPR